MIDFRGPKVQWRQNSFYMPVYTPIYMLANMPGRNTSLHVRVHIHVHVHTQSSMYMWGQKCTNAPPENGGWGGAEMQTLLPKIEAQWRVGEWLSLRALKGLPQARFLLVSNGFWSQVGVGLLSGKHLRRWIDETCQELSSSWTVCRVAFRCGCEPENANATPRNSNGNDGRGGSGGCICVFGGPKTKVQ